MWFASLSCRNHLILRQNTCGNVALLLIKSGLGHNFWLECTSDLKYSSFAFWKISPKILHLPDNIVDVPCDMKGGQVEYLQNLSKCSSGMFISGRCSTPVKSYGRNLIQATSPNVFCLVKELGTKGTCQKRFSGIRPLRGGGRLPPRSKNQNQSIFHSIPDFYASFKPKKKVLG